MTPSAYLNGSGLVIVYKNRTAFSVKPDEVDSLIDDLKRAKEKAEMDKFELRMNTMHDGTESGGDDNWAIVNTDTDEVVMHGTHDDYGWVGYDLFENFTEKLNQLHEHPEDF